MKKLILATSALVLLSGVSAHAEHADGKSMMEKHREYRLEAMDADGDGRVSKAEFLAKHEEMFDKKDANGDGFIDEKEREAARAAMKEKMMEKREEMRERHGKKSEDSE